MATGRVHKAGNFMYEPSLEINASPSRYYSKSSVSVDSQSQKTIDFGSTAIPEGKMQVFCGVSCSSSDLIPYAFMSNGTSFSLRNNTSSNITGKTLYAVYAFIDLDDVVEL